MRPPAPASGSGLGELTLRLFRARGGDPGACHAPKSLRRRRRGGGHFPFYSPLPDGPVDWCMLPTHPLHAALAKRLGLGPNAIITIQGKATVLDSATATFNTHKSQSQSGYHFNDERLQVFQLQALVRVVDGEVILSGANLQPFSKAFSSKVSAASRSRSRSRSRAVRAVVAGRRAWAEQGQLLLEVFVTMAELEKYGLFDEDGYLIQINLPIPDGRPCGAPEDEPEWVEEGDLLFFPTPFSPSPDLTILFPAGSKRTSDLLKRCLTEIRRGSATDFTPLYRHSTVPADAADFLRGETRSLASVMDGDGPDQAVLGAWEAQGWPKRQRRR